ncbi:MAG: flagellar hook protein FlgE [Clostridiales bacterium]|nr:flagellar hook protein FlgE [Eubacteriales bacterium]MDH7565006.1 flagellar hook protein FlgE [Clostridiales bacterium]
MMRSMFSGVSGLRAHQTRMDVIGNNVANVNTVGFKSGRVTFQEVFSETLKGATAPDAATGRGGSNPMQVGLGIGIGAVDTITTRGSVQRTDNPTDLSIEGEGFFIVKGGEGDTYRFTRAGNFGIDKLGNLVTGGGLNVYGWQQYTRNPDGSYTFDTEQPIEPVNLYSDAYNKNKRMIAAKATTSAVFAGNLDASKKVITAPDSSNVEFTIPVTVYDSIGNDYKININFWKTDVVEGSSSTWTWQIGSGSASGLGLSVASGTITFDNNGQIMISSGGSGASFNVTFTPVGSGASAGPFTVNLDFSKLTMYAADSSAKPTNVDGYPTGNLVTFNIGSDGMITGIYSNGQQQPLGMIALASFENPAGLQKVGDNLYIPTTNSGDFKKGLKAGSEGVGTLNPGTLEMSNVDLSKEFTDMIITQRGFQANSRIITTSDEMLQELVNLKR